MADCGWVKGSGLSAKVTHVHKPLPQLIVHTLKLEQGQIKRA